MRISFLIHDAYGIGGTIRTVINLAEALSARHEVEIVSVYRRRARPLFDVPDRVRLTPLVDIRRTGRDRRHKLAARPSQLVPASEQYYDKYSALTDTRIGSYLRETRAEIVVATRPSLNLLLAQLAPESTVTVAQEHMTYDMMPPGLHQELRVHYPRLDASVTVTEADAAVFRRNLDGAGLRVLCIPNSVPEPTVPPSDCSGKIVMAAGRLVDWKRFDVLVHAFARVAAERPDWSLRIYGEGSQTPLLRALVAELDLHNHVFFMGRQSPLDPEWGKAAIAAASSDREPFGMTLVEAMRCGLPVVSTACDFGPPEIIRHGEDGLLVPVGDPDAMAAGLLELIDDGDRRRTLGRAAWENSRRYRPERVVGEYEDLFRELAEAKGIRYAPSRRSVAVRVASGRRRARAAIVRTVPNRVRRWLGRGPRPGPPMDCWFDPAGRLVVGLRPPTGWVRGRHLLCQEREDTRGERRVRAPLTRDGTDPAGARTVAVLDPAGMPEGRWDLFLVNRIGRRQRVQAGLRDVRALLDPAGVPAAGPVARLVPYPTAAGYLAIRSWAREPHAEVGAVWYDADALTVAGRLIGGTFDPAPALRLARREDGAELLVAAGGTGDRMAFHFDVPVGRLVERRLTRRDEWELWIVERAGEVGGGSGGEPVRIAHLLDDVAEKQAVYAYPEMVVAERPAPDLAVEVSPEPRITVTPRYTGAGELSLIVADEG